MKYGVYLDFNICMHIRNEDTSTDAADGRHFENENGRYLNSAIGHIQCLHVDICVVFIIF